jgi:hypothetical protein
MAVPLFVNFGIGGMERIVHELRAALARRGLESLPGPFRCHDPGFWSRRIDRRFGRQCANPCLVRCRLQQTQICACPDRRLQIRGSESRVAGCRRAAWRPCVQRQGDLLCLCQADSNQARGLGQGSDNAYVIAQKAPEQGLQVPHDAVEANRTRRRAFLATDGHELPDQRCALDGSVSNLVHPSPQRIRRLNFGLRQVAVGESARACALVSIPEETCPLWEF